MIIAWFSCGVTSAVACKIALSLYDDVQIYYIETGSGHPIMPDSLQIAKNGTGSLSISSVTISMPMSKMY